MVHPILGVVIPNGLDPEREEREIIIRQEIQWGLEND